MAEKKTCLDTALALLARREHAVKELRSKLMRKDYAPADINQVIEKLTQNNMLSDARYAAARARYRANISRWGASKIRQELLAAGVDKSGAETALNGLSDDGIEMPKVAKAAIKGAKTALQRSLGTAPADPALGGHEKRLARQKAYDKLLAKLLRKGFTLGEAKTAIADAQAEVME